MSFSENQKATLLTYFDNGMVGVGKKFESQIAAASAETSLTEKQVKNWIAKQPHRRKGKAADKVHRVKSSEAIKYAHSTVPRKDRTKCGWNIFQKEYATTEEGKNTLKECELPNFNKKAAAKFREMPAEEKARYNQLAAEEESTNLTELQKTHKISNIFTKLRNNTILEDYGCHTLVIGFRKDKYYIAESDSITNKLSDRTIQQLYSSLFNNNEENTRKFAQDNQLRKDVQDLFNTKYSEATGEDTPFPYKRKHEFEVDGLPSEIPFRKPSGYGVGQLKKILESRDHIGFRIKQTTCRERETAPRSLLPAAASTASVALTSSSSLFTHHSPISSISDLDVPTVTSLTSMTMCTTSTVSLPSASSSPSTIVVSSHVSQDQLAGAEDHLVEQHDMPEKTSPLPLRQPSKKRWLGRRPVHKPQEPSVYPFWSKVTIMNEDEIAVAEGVIVPGSNTEDSYVSNSFRRKIYVTKVSGMKR
ncbi:uncharacterized protein LOC114542438 [Dendronephthya gigantea]|uniref:uncharacterized protein LOC114542438 n=1 Tax=Dendronephthya gigantea TaxID=151771 RepID=UPI001069BB3E|nr:uncharacterized protein LOC114542438 [Dendronephthya gigantea]